MAKTQTTIRIDEDNYTKAKDILSEIGLSYSQAISVFNKMIILNNGLPFDVKIPNNQTNQALQELSQRDGKSFNNLQALFDDLDD